MKYSPNKRITQAEINARGVVMPATVPGWHHYEIVEMRARLGAAVVTGAAEPVRTRQILNLIDVACDAERFRREVGEAITSVLATIEDLPIDICRALPGFKAQGKPMKELEKAVRDAIERECGTALRTCTERLGKIQ